MLTADPLFSTLDLRAVLDNHGRKMVEEIDGILGERLLATNWKPAPLLRVEQDPTPNGARG